jgi:hypothetical protein
MPARAGLHTFTVAANPGSRTMTHISMTLPMGSEPLTARNQRHVGFNL